MSGPCLYKMIADFAESSSWVPNSQCKLSEFMDKKSPSSVTLMLERDQNSTVVLQMKLTGVV